MTRLRMCACSAVLLLLASRSVAAQFPVALSEAVDSALANRCAAVEAQIDPLTADQWTDVQVLSIVRCDQSGPPRVALIWSTFPNVAVALSDLRLFSMSLNDGRLATALAQLAQDPSRSSAVRCAALDVLVGFAIPTVSPMTISTTDTVANTRLQLGDAPDRHTGAVQIPVNYVTTVHGLVTGLSASDPDSTTRDHSARILSALDAETRFNSRPTVDQTKIVLAYVCGNRFSLRNSNSIPLILAFDVVGPTAIGSGQAQAEVQVDGVNPPATYAETIFDSRVKGTVRIFFNGTAIQVRPNGNKKCSW